MKSVKLLFIVCLMFAGIIYGQITETFCGNEDHPEEMTEVSATGQKNLVLLFVDFQDGRVGADKHAPSQAELNTPGLNYDAVGSLGFVKDPARPGYFLKQARKYTYEDYWNMFFSTNTFTGTAHPDNASHGIEAYGSFKEYYDEVSYGALDIIPGATPRGSTGMYNTGIINPIDEIGGKKYIRWMTLPGEKDEYSDYQQRNMSIKMRQKVN